MACFYVDKAQNFSLYCKIGHSGLRGGIPKISLHILCHAPEWREIKSNTAAASQERGHDEGPTQAWKRRGIGHTSTRNSYCLLTHSDLAENIESHLFASGTAKQAYLVFFSSTAVLESRDFV